MITLESALEIVYNKRRSIEANGPHCEPDCCFIDAHFDQITLWRELAAQKGFNHLEETEDKWSPYTPVKRAFESVLPKYVKVIVYGHGNKDRRPRIVMGTYGEME